MITQAYPTAKARKCLVFSTLIFPTPHRGNPLELLDETCPGKFRGIGLLCGENFTILTSTVFD